MGGRGYSQSMSIPRVVYKTQATGNDFLVYADPEGECEPSSDEVRTLCDRHFGIGADGLIRLAHPQHVSDIAQAVVAQCEGEGVDWFMDYRNSDGSIAQMCGNGTRAISLFAQKRGYAQSRVGSSIRLATRAGIKTLTSLGDVEPYGRNVFRVDMGGWRRGDRDAYTVSIPGTAGEARGTFVDMGNPHVVAVLEDGTATLPSVEALNLQVKPSVNPALESDQNVEFVRVDSLDTQTDLGAATMRVNERGCGETLSCGTGLCAAGITLRERTGVGHWIITVRGGTLRVDVSDGGVSLTGASQIVGKVELCELFR